MNCRAGLITLVVSPLFVSLPTTLALLTLTHTNRGPTEFPPTLEVFDSRYIRGAICESRGSRMTHVDRVLGRTRGVEEERHHPPTFPTSAQRRGVVGTNAGREGAMLGATVAAQPVQQAINVVTPPRSPLIHPQYCCFSSHRTGLEALHVMPSIGTGVISK